MIPPALSRRVAAFLLQSAISIAPHDTLDWGHAMLGELPHIEENWSALLWALGSATVLAKHALLSPIFPSRNHSTIPSGRDLFSKEGSMRKSALVVTTGCVVASLLLFIAPVFRQAFSISLLQWETVFKRDYRSLDPQLDSIVRKAEQNHDAEALAFAAFRHYCNSAEIARLTDESVRLDPSLTWAYAVIAVRCSNLPQIDHWLSILEKYDPQNALPHLIAAEKIDIDQVLRHEAIARLAEYRPAAWKDAVATAFHSSKLDTYFDRVKQLDRHVLLRYKARDPSLAAEDAWFYGLPSYAISDSASYAELLLRSAQAHEREGDSKAASEEYLAVVQFGQLLSPEINYHFVDETRQAYTRLSALAAKSSRPTEASFYMFLANSARHTEERASSSRCCGFRRNEVSRWDADLARRSGLAMLLSASLLIATVFAVVLRSRSLRLRSLKPGTLAVVLGVGSSTVLLGSAVLLRLSYQPYAQIVQRFIDDGDETGLTALSDFVGRAYTAVGSEWVRHGQDYPFYFWFAVVILCVLALIIAVFRYFQTRSHPHSSSVGARALLG